MMKVLLYLLIASASAAPPPDKRQLLGLGGLLGDVLNGINDSLSRGDVNGVLDSLKQAKPTSRPAAPADAMSRLRDIVQTEKPTNILQYNAMLSTNGLLSVSVDSLLEQLNGLVTAENSETNSNPEPPTTVYPSKLPCDAPYTNDESTLRSAIYIPPGFTYGKKPPVILFPGTGNHGYETFAGNFIPLLTNTDWADPIWVNVPFRLLADAQSNAEFAAYALNYIASLTSRSDITILAWSQGNIDTQWAFKYFPSTRLTTTDHVAISPDYKGTIFANFLCPDGLASCNPSVYQQEFLDSSDFITAMRANGGDSAYVPTTTVYSALFDEIVEPQQGTDASAFLLDARGVGVSNNEVQSVCAGGLAGTFYTHEGVLYNPLSLALLKDAMTHDGPADVERASAPQGGRAVVCAPYLAPGLELDDLLVTENAVLIAGLGVLVGQPRTKVEPSLRAYAAGTGETCAAA